MQRNKDKFESITGKKLREFEIKPPDNLWDKIDSGIQFRKRRILIFRISSIAASLLLLVSAGFFYLNIFSPINNDNSIVADKVLSKKVTDKKTTKNTYTSDSAEAKDRQTRQIELKNQAKDNDSKGTNTNSTKPVKKTIPSTKRITPVNRNSTGNNGTNNYLALDNKVKPGETEVTIDLPISSPQLFEEQIAIVSIPTDSILIESKPRLTNIEDLLPDKSDLVIADTKAGKLQSWSLALGYNITSGEEFNRNGEQLSSSRSSYSYDQFSAYLANETSYFEEVENTSHDAPISFGVTIEIPVTRRISLETGVLYTRLGFRIKTDEFGSYYSEYRNQIHYLGVPAGISYTFLERRRMDLYALQWFVFEKGIAGKWYINEYGNNTLLVSESNNHKIKGVQLSSITGLGVQYRLTKYLHLFGQGGVQVFYLNKTQPYNIRSSHIAWPSIQTGLRLGF